jgi:Ala-tRNA(Pro) deacylase
MPATKLKQFLENRGIEYVSIPHPPAFTAPEVAESAHVTGRGFAKTVIVKTEGIMAMVLVPANRKIVLSDLRDMLGTRQVNLATEAEFAARFPDCELGAMPPFGNLYDLPVYIAQELTEESTITFNAGTHDEVITMPFAAFASLTLPTVIDLATV